MRNIMIEKLVGVLVFILFIYKSQNALTKAQQSVNWKIYLNKNNQMIAANKRIKTTINGE